MTSHNVPRFCVFALVMAGCGDRKVSAVNDAGTNGPTDNAVLRDTDADGVTESFDQNGSDAGPDIVLSMGDAVEGNDSSPPSDAQDTVLTPDAGLRATTCDNLPLGIFPPGQSTCFMVGGAHQGALACVVNPAPQNVIDVIGCVAKSAAIGPGTICSNTVCCRGLPVSSGPSPVCAWVYDSEIVAFGDAIDTEMDFVPDYRDNCPQVGNFFQADADGDGIGDVCDNCPSISNSDQKDSNSNGVGDSCDQGS